MGKSLGVWIELLCKVFLETLFILLIMMPLHSCIRFSPFYKLFCSLLVLIGYGTMMNALRYAFKLNYTGKKRDIGFNLGGINEEK